MVAKSADHSTSEEIIKAQPSVAEHLSRTALRLFALKGYTATSVSEIVEAAGVTKPMLYYYYGSKEQLARKLVVEPLQAHLAKLQALGESTGDPFTRQVAWLAEQLEFTRTDADRARFVFALYFGPLGAELAAAVGEFGLGARVVVTKIVRERPELAGWADERVEEYVSAIHGQMLSTVIEMLYAEPGSQRERWSSAELAARLMHGLDSGYIPRPVVLPPAGRV